MTARQRLTPCINIHGIGAVVNKLFTPTKINEPSVSGLGEPLPLHIHLLFQSGFGRKKQLWGLVSLADSRPGRHAELFEMSVSAAELFLLAGTFLRMATASILQQARERLGIRPYPQG